MKAWQRYREYLSTGEWHIHTRYTDGEGTVDEYCRRAEELGMPLLAFTEHVRKELDYDFNAFLGEIEQARDDFDLIILSGCEASILPGGEPNAPEWILREVDYPVVSFHSFPHDLPLYIDSLIACIRNDRVNTWAHPGAFLPRSGIDLDEDDLAVIFREMAERGVALELNRKYRVPANTWIELAGRYGVPLIRGSDAHAVKDLSAA